MKKLFILSSILVFCLNLNAQEGNYVESNGVKIYYETYGEGEPLLLLHGFVLSHKFWEPWIDELQKNHKLIIPDLRGHGRSTNPSNTFTHKLSAKDMYGLMDHLKIENFKAIGHSSGGITLIHMSTMSTSRITSMILIDSPAYFPKKAKEILANISYETEDEDWLAYLMVHHPRKEEQIRKLLIQINELPNHIEDMKFTPPYLSRIESRTLIIFGERDHFYDIDVPVYLYKSIPDSYLWVVPNEGHIPLGLIGKQSIWSGMFGKVVDDFFYGNWE